MMRTAQLFPLVLALALGHVTVTGRAQTATAPGIDEIWIEPTDLERRDLFRGPAIGPPILAAGAAFTFLEKDTTGRSPGYDVRDGRGVVWSVKLGAEAQSEVVASRMLWAIGFHQPPMYHLRAWRLTGAPLDDEDFVDDRTYGGRFRPELSGWKVVADRWDWADNPHMVWRPHAGLLVAQMFINNWDLKDSNNKVYEVTDGSPGPRRRYVVRDLGASLGLNEQSKWWRWTQLRNEQGTKNDLAGFLASGFIEGVADGRVDFEYSGPNEPLVSNITPEDVRWTMALLSRLSDEQWHDAFRAGGYAETDASEYIARFKVRIEQGLTLR